MDFNEGSFTESEFISFDNAAGNTFASTKGENGMDATSPSRRTFSEAEFLGVVAQKSQSSPHPQYLTGYTGIMRSMRHRNGEEHAKIEPALGYSGSYVGKVNGKLGKINLHRGLISREESHPAPKQDFHMDDTHEYDPRIEGNYQNALLESASRGQTITRVLREITDKFNFKYASMAERKMRIKSVFEGCDPQHTGFISASHFNMCCVQLNIVLPREELTSLISYFDECNSGHIRYRAFINIICPGAYERV